MKNSFRSVFNLQPQQRDFWVCVNCYAMTKGIFFCFYIVWVFFFFKSAHALSVQAGRWGFLIDQMAYLH